MEMWYHIVMIISGVGNLSEGCPYGCVWCNSSSLQDHPYRNRGMENVIQEIEFLLTNYRRKIFVFHAILSDGYRSLRPGHNLQRRVIQGPVINICAKISAGLA